MAVGCQAGPPPTPEEIANQFDIRKPSVVAPIDVQSASPARSATKPPLDLYFDASDSMLGYMSPAHSTFSDVLDTCLDRLPAHYDMSYHKFTDTVTPLNAIDIEEARKSPQTFFRGETSIVAALDSLPPPSRSPRIAVLLTDGIQSDGHGHITSIFIEALQKKISEGWRFTLLGFPSAYEGKVFSEKRPGTFQRYKGERPFYAFVLGSTPAAARDCIAELKTKSSKMFPSEGLQEESADLDWPTVDGHKDLGDSLDFYDDPQRLASAPATRVCYLSPRSGRASETTLVLNLAPIADVLTVPDLSSVRFRVNGKMRSKSGNWSDAPSLPDPIVKPGIAEGTSPIETATVKLTFPSQPNGAWAVYRLTYEVPRDKVAPPAWLQDWSTDDDTTRSSLDKSFKMYELIQSLALPIVAGSGDVRLGEQFFVVGGV